MLEKLNEKLEQNRAQVDRCLNDLISRYQPPVYTSFDLRCNGHKAVAVDPNVFPAGFNNICLSGVRLAATLLMQILYKRFDSRVKTVGLYPEDHTKNKYYLENLHALKELLRRAGFKCIIASTNPEVAEKPLTLDTAEGNQVTVHPLEDQDGNLHAAGEEIDVLLSNNDFSVDVPEIISESTTPVIPPPEMGWHRRSKFNHFQKQRQVLEQIAELLGVNPWYLLPETRRVEEVDFAEKKGFDRIAAEIDSVIEQAEDNYEQREVDEPVRAFVKGDRGTYGMNVYSFSSGEEFLEISRSRRDSLDRRKGGEKNDSVIVQEGVRTRDRVEGVVAEPVIYCLEHTPICGFLRTNDEQSDLENLNARGMAFTPENLCPLFIDSADKNVGSNLTQNQIEVYKLLATSGTIACGMEIDDLSR